MDSKNVKLSMFIISGIALTISILIASLDLQTILSIIPDDPFYYFQIASNFISGKGSSINGIQTTNGYHPLWMLIISPLFALKTYNEILPVRLVIVLSELFSIATSYILYLIINTITRNKLLSIVGFGLYLLTPKIFLTNIIGEPVPLSNFFIIIGLFLTLRISIDGILSLRRMILIGIIFGLTILSRIDNIIFILIYIFIILLWYKGENRLLRVGFIGILTILIASPWFIWSLRSLGTIKQTSIDACSFIFKHNILKNCNDIHSILKESLISIFNPSSLLYLFGYSSLSYTLPFIIGSLFGCFKEKDIKLQRGVIIILTMTLATFILYIIHTGIFFYIRIWQVASFSSLTILIIISSIYIYSKSKKVILILISILLSLYLFSSSFTIWREIQATKYPFEIDFYKVAEYINKDKNHKYSAYDSGIISYFTDGKVLSIDGNINPEAYNAFREHRICDYMIENDVDYLVGKYEWTKFICEPFCSYPFNDVFKVVKNNDVGINFDFTFDDYVVLKFTRPYKTINSYK